MDDFIGFWAITCAVALPILFAITTVCIVTKSRHEERMKMIEKGMILQEPEKPANRYPALRNGLFMIGLTLGIIIGLFIQSSVPYGDYDMLTVPACAILFAGIGFVVYFFLSRKMIIKEEKEDKERKKSNVSDNI